MTNSIGHIGKAFVPGIPPTGISEAGPASPPGGPSFKEMMLESLQNTNQLQESSQQAIQKGLLGEDITQAEVFTSVKKADLALRMMVQMRNKLLEAYNEVQRMQL